MMSSLESDDGRGVPPDSGYMVSVRNAWKSYNGTDYVLQGLNINIPKGQIYSLLGSSGVGKTTLLNCITGNISLDYGEIDVDINSKLQIGYMPQELALYSELTLDETFRFFGMMFYMSKSEVAERLEGLTELLQLPSLDTQISTLSGGQQRRVSVAVTMMKNPDLLILDEPTVSLDSLLKQSIWNYLNKISKENGKTILLTTHYIEEANNSDKVGFMSNGRILLEGSPRDVLNVTDPPLERLEDVYYKLCYQEKETSQPSRPSQDSKPAAKLFEEYSSFSMKRIVALFLKSLFYIKRNILLFYLFIFSPALLTVILTAVVDKPKDLKLGYVNYEDDCSANAINCSTPLSCRYLNKLSHNDFNMIRYNSVDIGKAAVQKNDVWGLVRFNWNFSAGVVNRLDYFYAAEHVEISDEDEARVWLDMSSHPIGYIMKREFYDSFLESIEDWYTDCGWNTKAAHPILRVEEYIHGKNNDALIYSVIPTTIICVMFSAAIALGLIFVLSDRELGTLDRCKVTGLKTEELLVSAFLTSFISLIPAGIVQLLILYLYSGPAKAPVFWTVILLYLQVANGVLLGSLIGLITTNLAKAMQFTTGVILPLTFLSGMIWPIETAHWFAKFLYTILPYFIPAGAVRIMSNKGLDKYELCCALADSFIWIAIILTGIFISIRKNNKR